MNEPFPPPCIHAKCGCGGLCDSGLPCPMAENAGPLCPACTAEFDEDPEAYLEFGDHPAGIERWKAEQEAIAAEVRKEAEERKFFDDEIPF